MVARACIRANFSLTWVWHSGCKSKPHGLGEAMRRRLYFLLPDVVSAQRLVDDLLLARIDARRIHVLGRRGMDLGDLPEASVLQKTDVIHGAQIGMLLGAALGALGGLLSLLIIYPHDQLPLSLATILIGSLFGGLFGMWTASLVGAAVPNSRLKQFRVWIDGGMILLMVDVPFRDAQRITSLVTSWHPEAMPGGVEPTIPAFP
jgi:hypothetical protein